MIADLNESFYVGDAAGRPNDHSDADRGLARAIGIRFFTPEVRATHPCSSAATPNTLRQNPPSDSLPDAN